MKHLLIAFLISIIASTFAQAQSPDQLKILDSAKSEAQKKIDSTNWVGGTKPQVISASVLDSVKSLQKTYFLVEVSVDMDPLHPGLKIEKWQYVVSEDDVSVADSNNLDIPALAQDSAKSAVQKKIDSKNWIGGTKPQIIGASVLDSVESLQKTYFLIEVIVDTDPLLRPGLKIEKWQYVVLFKY